MSRNPTEMTTERRLAIYGWQNRNERRLTPRQRRRVVKKAHREGIDLPAGADVLAQLAAEGLSLSLPAPEVGALMYVDDLNRLERFSEDRGWVPADEPQEVGRG